MKTIKPPPKYVNIPTHILYDRTISKKILFTYIQLRGLAYETGGKRTPKLAWNELIEFFGESRTTIYNHLSELSKRGWLQFKPSQRRMLEVEFEDPKTLKGVGGFSSEFPDKDRIKEEDIDSDLLTSSSLIPDSDQLTVRKFGQPSENLDELVLDPDMKAELLKFGVFEDSLKDVVRKMREGVTEEQIYELMDLCKREGNRPAGLFVHRLKNLKPGQNVSPKRDENYYLGGEYGDFVQH